VVGGGTRRRYRGGVNKTIAAVLLCLVALVGACDGSSGHSAASSTTRAATSGTSAPSPRYAKWVDYLAMVAAVNGPLCTFSTKIQALPQNATSADTQSLVDPAVAAITDFNTKMTQVDWSPAVKPDAVAMEQAAAALSGDVASLPQQTVSSVSQWSTTVNTDNAKLRAANNTLRHDLGLPAVNTNACGK
jgi:hypothetical protein